LSYGVRFLHLNNFATLDKNFNLVTRLAFDYGTQVGSKYIFAGVALNYFLQERDEEETVYAIHTLKINAGKVFGFYADFWPGYTVGIQL
jgi:hypothetical protein